MPLSLVPPRDPSAAERVRLRLKAQRIDGMLQCARCGCRTVLNTEAGVLVRNGRRVRGTVIDRDVCAECWRRGAVVPMAPELKPAH